MTFVRVRAAAVPRLRAWLDSLAARREELSESYLRQRTRHELFYLVESGEDPILVMASESLDLVEGAREFLTSELGIDVEFKELVQEIRSEEPRVELVFDSQRVLADPESRS